MDLPLHFYLEGLKLLAREWFVSTIAGGLHTPLIQLNHEKTTGEKPDWCSSQKTQERHLDKSGIYHRLKQPPLLSKLTVGGPSTPSGPRPLTPPVAPVQRAPPTSWLRVALFLRLQTPVVSQGPPSQILIIHTAPWGFLPCLSTASPFFFFPKFSHLKYKYFVSKDTMK